MHIGILQCDSVDSALQPQFGDYPAMHRRLLSANAGHRSLTFQTYNLTQGQFPETTDECDAWLFTGSKWSAYDTDDWIARAQQFAQDLYAARRPTIGICFGHQLICQALGGKVEKVNVGWGVGVHTTNIFERRSWMEPGRNTLSLLVSHQDQVIEPPTEAALLAGHPFCPHDMLEIGGFMLTLQGHPEFSKGYSRAVMDKRRDIIGASTYQAGIASLEQSVYASVAANWMLGFLESATVQGVRVAGVDAIQRSSR
jgi:GMP synthase-like glutamine amidotransferase